MQVQATAAKGDSKMAALGKGFCCIMCRGLGCAGSDAQRQRLSGVQGCVLAERGAVLGSCSPEWLCFLQVASTLTRTSLVPQNQPVKVLSVNQVSKSLLVGPLGGRASGGLLTPACVTLWVRHQELTLPTASFWMQREIEGRMYYEFEFASKAKTYIRYAIAAATVGNGEQPACCFQTSPLLARECCTGHW